MVNEMPLLFVCDVLPTTRFRAFNWVWMISLATALAVLILTGALVAEGKVLGCAITAALSLAMLMWSAGNPMLAFYREYQSVQGLRSPLDSICSAHWPCFAIATGVITLVSPTPVWAVALLGAGLLPFTALQLRRFQRRFRAVLTEFIDLVFIYIGYPDSRFSGPSGNQGLWLPTQTMICRLLRLCSHVVPLYVVTGIAIVEWTRGQRAAPHDSGVWGGICIGLLLLAPYVLLFVSQLAPLAKYLQLRQDPMGAQNQWERAVGIVANSHWLSGGLGLADHFFIGWHVPAWAAAAHPFKFVGKFDLACRTPALLLRSIIYGHVHLLGSSQSGKTSIGLTTLLVQLIRGWDIRAFDRFGRPVYDGHGKQVWQRSPATPTLIIDMKGDLALFNTVREECHLRGLTFKFFTLDGGRATSYFNALPNLGIGVRHVAEFCELILNALSLFHGLSYGRSYYSKQSRDLILKALKSATRVPTSWEELYALLLDEIDPKKHKDVFELVSSIFALAQYPVLGPAPAGVDVIHMPTVVAERQVVYFSLPARLSAISARDVGKLALFAFVTAAADWNDRNEERRCVVCLDEAQIICSSNLATLFQQCSGAKTSIIFSNQARTDLDVPDAPKLSETVRVNTRFKQMFTVADPRDAQDLISLSGERLGILRSFMQGTDSMGKSTSSLSEKETLYEVLNQNEINAVNNDPNGSLVHVITDAGFTALSGVPRHIQTPYPMSESEYRRRMHTPWPTAPQLTDATGGAVQTVVNVQEPEQVQAQAEQDYADLMAFFRKTARRAGRDRMRDWVEPND